MALARLDRIGDGGEMVPTELTARYVAAFNKRDPESMWAMVHPEVRYTIAGAQPTVGLQAVKDYYLPLLKTDVQAETWRSQEEGDTAFIETRLTGTTSDGRRFAIEGAVRQQWSEGLLVDYRSYADPPVVDGKPTTFAEFLEMMGADSAG